MKLKAKLRKLTGKKVKNMRAEGEIPASVYGPKTEPVSISVDPKEFAEVFGESGYSTLFELEVEGGKPMQVLIKEVQTHPLLDNFLHVSFYSVDMTKPITTEVPIEFEGMAPAVKNNLGLLVTPIAAVTVQCLPKDLPSELTININELVAVGDSVSLGSIKLPEGVELAHGMSEEMTLVYIAAPQKEIVSEVEETEESEESTEDAEGSEESAESAEKEASK